MHCTVGIWCMDGSNMVRIIERHIYMKPNTLYVWQLDSTLIKDFKGFLDTSIITTIWIINSIGIINRIEYEIE